MQVLDYIDKEVVQQMIGNREILTDEDRLKATTGLKIDSAGMICEVVYPTQVTDFDKIPLQVSIQSHILVVAVKNCVAMKHFQDTEA